MSKDHFEFRHFIVRQDRCAMKVGTDGTLLGAWAEMAVGEGRVLDIGTGTGLIALMMAQRYPACWVKAIDIDPEACLQAARNVEESPFADRIEVILADVADFTAEERFDAIVSNPPYFQSSLECPDSQRTTARHTSSLSYASLISSAFRLLKDDGRFSLIIPDDCLSSLMAEIHLAGFFVSRHWSVRTTPAKPPKRHLIEITKHPVDEINIKDCVLQISSGERSPWYRELTRDFYIR